MSESKLVDAQVSASRKYFVIAEKNGAKFAINCSVFPNSTSLSKTPTNVVCLRMVEVMKPTGQEEPEFNAFDFRGTDTYKMDGDARYFFRGEKYPLPFSREKDTEKAINDALEAKIPQQIADWFEFYVERSDAELLVPLSDIVDYLKSEFDAHLPKTKQAEFKLPDLTNVVPYKVTAMLNKTGEEE